MREALLYEALKGSAVKCRLCGHSCRIQEGRKGICGVRVNQGGKLFSLVYGRLISQNIDPIEKKPLYHFYPGSGSYSIASVGCNFRCRHCQNHDISQMPRDHGQIMGKRVGPEEVVQKAKSKGCRTIAYTYTEPTIFFEYALDTAKMARDQGILNVFVTNGYMSLEALETFYPYLDAANVDLKAFKEEFYKDICGASMKPVLNSIQKMKEMGTWVEITTLIIPGLNDDEDQLAAIADFIMGIGADIPWHISAFFPTYKLTDRPPTAAAALHRARQIGLERGLRYVYTGNIPGDEGETTFCYRCRKPLILRFGYRILENRLDHRRCPSCNTPIDGVGL